jgi:hypothetical protein
MARPDSPLTRALGPLAAQVETTAAEVRAQRERLAVSFPALPRKLGRDSLRAGMAEWHGARVDLDAWRRCDAGACLLLEAVAATPAELGALYAHGDLEERAMLLRSLALLPIGPATVQLLAEVQRTNIVAHVEAAVCDSDLLARTIGTQAFGVAEGNRLLLKLAFLDLPLQRVFAVERHANAELSRMLQDLATEREAAGRSVWRDTWRMIGRAPTAGSVARLVGGLEHGDDGVRLAAVEGLQSLGRADLLPFARERLDREVRTSVRAALQRLLQGSA